MLIHLIHTSPYTCSCIKVGPEQVLKNGVHDRHLSIHITHNRFQSHIGITYMAIIMLGSSYGTRSMKNKREIDQATPTNSYSTGVLLPLHHGYDGGYIGEGKDPCGGCSG
jgi:hypothetical protein